MFTLYGRQIKCEYCKSVNIKDSGITKIGDDCSTNIHCGDCKEIYFFSWSVREEVEAYKNRERNKR